MGPFVWDKNIFPFFPCYGPLCPTPCPALVVLHPPFRSPYLNRQSQKPVSRLCCGGGRFHSLRCFLFCFLGCRDDSVSSLDGLCKACLQPDPQPAVRVEAQIMASGRLGVGGTAVPTRVHPHCCRQDALVYGQGCRCGMSIPTAIPLKNVTWRRPPRGSWTLILRWVGEDVGEGGGTVSWPLKLASYREG